MCDHVFDHVKKDNLGPAGDALETKKLPDAFALIIFFYKISSLARENSCPPKRVTKHATARVTLSFR